MRAFIFYLLAMCFTLIASVIGISTRQIPQPNALSVVLATTASLAVGFKFVLSEKLSSDGFQLSKTAVDLSLATSFAVLSLALAQHITGHPLQGPLLLFQGRIGSPVAATWALWLLTLFLLASAFLLALKTKQYAKNILRYRSLARALDGLSGLIGTISFAAYVTAVFFKA
jgi:hypothetical protein